MVAQTVVKISEKALCILLMAATESYVVKNQNLAKPQNRLETYGLLFGNENRVASEKRILNIEVVSPSNSVRQTRSSVEYSFDSLLLKSDIVQSCFPHLSFLGDFHTHPYRHFSEVKKCKGYYLSQEDRDEFKSTSRILKSLGYRVGLVAAISYAYRAAANDARYASEANTISITLGSFRIWLTAYVTRTKHDGSLFYSGDEASDVILHVPSMTGMEQFASMGGIKFNSRGLTYESCLQDRF